MAIFDFLDDTTKAIALGFMRHALTTAGGGFVAKGLLSGDDLTAGVAAIVTLVGIAWSALSKKKAANAA